MNTTGPSDSSDSTFNIVAPIPSITLIKTGPAIATPNSDITQTFRVTNTSSIDIPPIDFENILPTGATYISSTASNSSGCVPYATTTPNTQVWCGPIPLTPGQSWDITIKFKIPATAQCGSALSHAVYVSNHYSSAYNANLQVSIPVCLTIQNIQYQLLGSISDAISNITYNIKENFKM